MKAVWGIGSDFNNPSLSPPSYGVNGFPLWLSGRRTTGCTGPCYQFREELSGIATALSPTSAKKAGLGTIDPARALTITKTYVEAFFGEYLEGRKSPLLNGPSPEYPEITFETNKKSMADRALTF